MTLQHWKQWARQLKREVLALYLAQHDPRVPWHARLLIIGVVAYACSPIDLIPDVIPVIGYLDDLILVPLGIAWAIRLIPPAVMAEYRQRAEERLDERKPVNWAAGTLIIIVWLLLVAILFRVILHALRHR